MVIEFIIMGGYLKIHKNVFVQEMLSKDSGLRRVLNWNGVKDFSKGHPMISEPNEDNVITVDFSGLKDISIGESPKEVLGELKRKYKDKIKGIVYCRAVYGAFGGVFTFKIGMDSDGEEIDYMTN